MTNAKKTNAMTAAVKATNVMTAKEIYANAKSAGIELFQSLEIIAKAFYTLAVLAIELGKLVRSKYNEFYSRNDVQAVVIFSKKTAKAISTQYTKVSKSDRLAPVRQLILEVIAQINALPAFFVQLGQSVQIK